MKKPDLFSRVGIAFLVLAILLNTVGAYECWDGTVGAKAWYTLDNAQHTGTTTIDSCGYQNMTEYNTPTTGVNGRFGEAYDFNVGSSEYLEASKQIFTSYPYSVSVWAKSAEEASARAMWSIADSGSNNDYAEVLQLAAVDNGKLRIFNKAGGTAQYEDSTTSLTNAGWTSIIAVYHNNTHKELFINGTSEANETINSVFPSSIDRMSIGRLGRLTASAYWEDQLDEVGWFNYSLAYSNGTRDLTQIINLVTYNNVSGLVCDINFYPTAAPLNENQVFTGTSSATCGATTNNYWNFTRLSNGVMYFSGITNPITHALNYTGDWEVTYYATIGGINKTSTQTVVVGERPTANFTVETTPPFFVWDSIQFNDTSTDPNTPPNTPLTNWYWDLNDTNTSTTQNVTNTFVEPGEYEVCLITTSSIGLNSTAHCENVTVNGFMLNVFNEKTWAPVANWTMTLSNSSYSRTFSNQSNTFVWDNFTSFPTGQITISLNADGYVGRNYYRTYNIGTYTNLNAYLLGSSDGLFSYFIVQDSLGSVLPDVVLTFQFLNSSAWVTAGETKTDDTGSASMWLDWTKSYTVTASKTRYSPVSKTFTPQAITYYLVMGTTSVFQFQSLNNSMWTSLLPTNPEINRTTDSVTMAVFDPANGISVCGLNLTFVNGTVFNSTNLTTEATLCTGTIVLATSGVGSETKFYAVPWFTATSTGDYDWKRLYNLVGSDGSAVTNSIKSLKDSWGSEALLMIAIFTTLIIGAASAFFLGSGATLVMFAVSGVFFYYGFFGAFAPLWFIAVVAGLAALYVERRQY